jgi:hypothetical protein
MIRPSLVLLAALACATPARAEVQGVAQACGGQVCAWLKPVLAAPPGWVEDKATGGANRLAVLVPKGTSFGSAPVRIYARAFLNEEGLAIEERVRINTRRWLEGSPGATHERVADIPRAGGQGVFQVYRYRNPARSQQPVELTAFGEDRDAQGRPLGILVVLTATSEAHLAAAEAGYRDVLRRF